MPEFADKIKKLINGNFQKSKIPLKINYLVIFRPVFHESPFENLEIINSPDRLLSCNSVHMQINMSHGDYGFEVELRYISKGDGFTNDWCQMMFCDIFPNEDPKVIQEKLSEIAKLTGMIILSSLDEIK